MNFSSQQHYVLNSLLCICLHFQQNKFKTQAVIKRSKCCTKNNIILELDATDQWPSTLCVIFALEINKILSCIVHPSPACFYCDVLHRVNLRNQNYELPLRPKLQLVVYEHRSCKTSIAVITVTLLAWLVELMSAAKISISDKCSALAIHIQ